MSTHILVPMDGSPLSKRALEFALSEPDAKVTALHVIDPFEPGYSVPADVDPDLEPIHGSDEWYDRARELAEELFEEVREVAAERDTDLETETIIGQPSRVIVDYADDNEVDQIVLGSHGRSGETRILLGSVAELVVQRSPVRVTVVR